MERLTMTSDKGGLAFVFDLDVTCEQSEIRKIQRLGEHLKAYEDTGLTPEQIREMDMQYAEKCWEIHKTRESARARCHMAIRYGQPVVKDDLCVGVKKQDGEPFWMCQDCYMRNGNREGKQ